MPKHFGTTKIENVFYFTKFTWGIVVQISRKYIKSTILIAKFNNLNLENYVLYIKYSKLIYLGWG